jgi:glycosyltransferase involved in cell wall biosynthesis
MPQVHFACVGTDFADRGKRLAELASRLQISSRVRFLGPRDDIARVMPAFDLLTLTSSYGEGFPNVVGEAMACGVPCVVTDVGDSAALVGDAGDVVPPRQPAALADAWRRLLTEPVHERRARGERARARIMREFSLPAIVRRYEALYERIACGVRTQ